MDITGSSAIVTGAASGIGRACALAPQVAEPSSRQFGEGRWFQFP